LSPKILSPSGDKTVEFPQHASLSKQGSEKAAPVPTTPKQGLLLPPFSATPTDAGATVVGQGAGAGLGEGAAHAALLNSAPPMPPPDHLEDEISDAFGPNKSSGWFGGLFGSS